MNDLNFTPRAINEIEDQRKRPITEVIGDFSLNTITLFVKKGLKLSDDNSAEEAIAKYFSEGHDMIELYLLIMEKLQKSGFLPKAMDLVSIKAAMASPDTFAVANQNTSVKPGLEAKKPRSV